MPQNRQYIVIALTATVLIGLFLSALFQATITRSHLTNAIRWENHTYVVSSTLQRIEADAARLYFVSRRHSVGGATTSVDVDFPSVSAQLKADIAYLKLLTIDRPVQQDRIKNVVEPLARLYVLALSHTEQANRDHAHTDSDQNAAALFERLKTALTVMQDDEARLLTQRTSRTQSTVRAMEASSTTVLLLGIMLVLASSVFLGRELNKRTRIEGELSRAHEVIIDDHANLSQITTFLYGVVNADLDLENVMRMVAQSAMELTHADGATVDIVDGDKIEMRVAIGKNVPPEGTRANLSTTIAGASLSAKQVLYADDCLHDDRVNREIAIKYSMGSVIAVPLGSEQGDQFVLKVISGKKRAFNDRDIATLELMAGIITTALARAAQHETLRATESRLGEELSRVADMNVVLEYQRSELERANSDLEALATTDGLTGLKNHRAFHEQLAVALSRQKRHASLLSVIMLDVDHFKSYNDNYGHPAGDEVLKRVASSLQSAVRDCDIVARYGGEEFAIILPDTGNLAATAIAERCRRIVEEQPWQHARVTASFGVASSDDHDTETNLLQNADTALYAAKRNGRNCVRIFDPDIIHDRAERAGSTIAGDQLDVRACGRDGHN